MPMNELPENPTTTDNWTLIRDVAVFQFKLVVDGLRDFILVPVSMVAGIVSLARGKDGVPGSQFYQLLNVGKQSEHWIDLFGAMRNAPPDIAEHIHFPDANMDDILDNIETFVRDEEKRGGMTTQARQRLEKVLRGLQNRRDTHSTGRTD
jgi:hypothetical protein